MNPGQQSDYAVDFLNDQGNTDGSSPDTNLFTSGQNNSGSSDTEDPVSRGQSPASKLDMFVPDRPRLLRGGLKRGGFPSGAIPNRTRGGRRIP